MVGRGATVYDARIRLASSCQPDRRPDSPGPKARWRSPAPGCSAGGRSGRPPLGLDPVLRLVAEVCPLADRGPRPGSSPATGRRRRAIGAATTLEALRARMAIVDAASPAGRASRSVTWPRSAGPGSSRRSRSGRVASTSTTVPGDEVGAADEPGHEPVDRPLVELRRAALLLDPAVAHDDDDVAHRQRLLLVVGHVDERDPDLALERLELDLHLLAELAGRARRAARRGAAPSDG